MSAALILAAAGLAVLGSARIRGPGDEESPPDGRGAYAATRHGAATAGRPATPGDAAVRIGSTGQAPGGGAARNGGRDWRGAAETGGPAETVDAAGGNGQVPGGSAGRNGGRRWGGVAARRWSAAGLGVSVALLVGGVVGVLAGVVVGIAGGYGLRRLESASVRLRRVGRQAELPLLLDLLSVCLRAGMPLVTALETVSAAMPGPFSADLRVVAGLQRLGARPAAAWAELADDPDLAPVVRTVARSAESGSRLAGAFERLAADRRAALGAAALARARSAGVLAMAPLGLCFLPAFVCLGIVPVVLSLAADVLP